MVRDARTNLGEFGKLQNVDGLVEVGGPRVDADYHLDRALPLEVVPEQVGDLRVSVGHAAGFARLLVLPQLLDARA